ncbi:GntR family transcriptional regulator [Steroidobacter flavus]|uniref:GntR family transcriptional regulator n=1 Tax=Steroidobacter flavus TaxID=1842136 RepID=A0ABV8T7J1_9GAMM
MIVYGIPSGACVFTAMSIVVRTLSDRVFEIVREQILKGQLPNGEPIRQDALANELGISKIPLREALARLEQEGLLINHPNRGYYVQAMSRDQVDEIYALRLSIEPQAAAYSSGVATDDDRAVAMKAFTALDTAAHSNLADVAVRNREFHIALVEPGRKVLTTQLVERLAVLAERYVIAHLEPAGRDARAHIEHQALFNAWLERDKRKVEKLLKEHIQGTLKDLRAQLKDSD